MKNKRYNVNMCGKKYKGLFKQLNKCSDHELLVVRMIIQDSLHLCEPKQPILVNYGFDSILVCPNCNEPLKLGDNYCATCGIRFKKCEE